MGFAPVLESGVAERKKLWRAVFGGWAEPLWWARVPAAGRCGDGQEKP